ncbi:MAG: efflux RND transporter periplasmic adaptor subunit [Clostridium sp.]|nr:efflux RND transporter periplasmic adaptor subunit [Clostridium sp.]
MKKKYLKYVVIGAIILVSTVAIYLVKATSDNSQVNSSSIETTMIGDSSQKIYINGIIQPIENKNIYLDASKGKVDTVSVTDGQSVTAGDVLFTYKNDTITSQIEELNGQISTYQTQKERLENKKKDSNNKLTEKKNSLSNLKSNPEDETAIASIQSLEAEIQGLETEISSYNDQLDTINDSIKDCNKKIENLKKDESVEVKADISGVVDILGSKEDYTNVFISITSNDLYIKGSVSEKYVEKLKKEQEAEVLVIANNSTIKAKVDEISKKPSTSSSIGSSIDASANSLSNYDVTLLLDSQENILDGYHVQATIFEEDKELKIPKEAIIEENGETFVYKVEDGALKKQNVEYENSENDDAKILSGLEEGDEVVTNPSKDTKEGMKYE